MLSTIPSKSMFGLLCFLFFEWSFPYGRLFPANCRLLSSNKVKKKHHSICLHYCKQIEQCFCLVTIYYFCFLMVLLQKIKINLLIFSKTYNEFNCKTILKISLSKIKNNIIWIYYIYHKVTLLVIWSSMLFECTV